jgi:actin related protein 2/3 complex subunit 5
MKDLNFKTVVKAMNAVKEGEIKSVVELVYKTLGDVGTDTLMKYVFRGLAEVESCGTMLKWHGAVVEVAGLGPVVRSMTDRKTV